MIDVAWDMETGDPDDLFTLFLLCGHPQVNLKCVTVVPGTPAQIGLVRQVLAWFGLDIPVGTYNIASEKQINLQWYYETFGKIPPSEDAELGYEVLLAHLDEQTTLLTGAPLKNVGALLKSGRELTLGRWVCQGGFAGEGVVPPEKQLPQFKGLTTCPSFNLNGDPKAVLAGLVHPNIKSRYFVSKNVCHGVYYDVAMHQIFAELKGQSLALDLIWKGMDAYLQQYPQGKKFHDPLAACCAIDPSIGTWAEVEIYREKGEWGARLSHHTNTMIITDYNHERFVKVLTQVT